ncbi:MAG: glyoxalase/bleomycin resistance/extradiol dioxygenase family protein [Bacteroidetes bacterium]|nr:glyoxalase/bleomycin resistance/extradiol dioxygenase family protein [Bacteroidota bacterium]
MASKLFVNLPVKHLSRSMQFFSELGFQFNPQFTDEKAACMIIGENIYAMLLTEPFFQTFTKKEICNAKTHTEVLLAIDASSREEVKAMVDKAIKAGGTHYMDAQDHGWMYQHSFADLDGHQWEILYMDEAALGQV